MDRVYELNDWKEVIATKETRSIKFYLDKTVNKSKKEEILNFLNECANVENELYKYFWEHYDIILKSRKVIDFNYNTKEIINFRNFKPRLKSHHFQQISQDVYGNLIGMRNKIRNQMKFYKDDSELAKIYKYCKNFCFEWNDMEKYIIKQIKKYKNKDEQYYDFLLTIQNIIDNTEKYNKLKADIEIKFWEYKNKMSCPIIKNPTIWCNTVQTIKLEQKNYYNWYFILNSNVRIGGSEKKGVYDKILIPIKYSDYHYKILKDIKLNNSFKIRLNQNNRIEIMATYNIDKQPPELNEIKDIVGIDIGLKKLIMSSDGELIDQNPKIINYAKYINKRKSNLWRLDDHLKEIRGDNYVQLSQKHLIRQASKLTHMVNCDNRYKIKQFLRGRDNNLIIMEDLNIQDVHLHRSVNLLLKVLHIQQIKEDVLKYCNDYGINIQLVNPAYTSQQCPICGYVDKKNRKTQEKFSCLNCGHTDNADHNASINIRDRIYIEDIKLDTPNWRIKELIALHYTTNN